MLDFYLILASVCSLIWGYYIALICRRLARADARPYGQWFFNQLHVYRRYLQLAPQHNWSRALPFVAGRAFLISLLSLLLAAQLLLSRS